MYVSACTGTQCTSFLLQREMPHYGYLPLSLSLSTFLSISSSPTIIPCFASKSVSSHRSLRAFPSSPPNFNLVPPSQDAPLSAVYIISHFMLPSLCFCCTVIHPDPPHPSSITSSVAALPSVCCSAATKDLRSLLQEDFHTFTINNSWIYGTLIPAAFVILI